MELYKDPLYVRSILLNSYIPKPFIFFHFYTYSLIYSPPPPPPDLIENKFPRKNTLSFYICLFVLIEKKKDIIRKYCFFSILTYQHFYTMNSVHGTTVGHINIWIGRRHFGIFKANNFKNNCIRGNMQYTDRKKSGF